MSSFSIVLSVLSMISSITAIAIALIALRTTKKFLVKKVPRTALPRRRVSRVKRYVLVKAVCMDGDAEAMFKELVPKLYRVLGPTIMSRCGLALVAYRKDLNRAILRVSGDPECVRYVLFALATMHIVLEESKCLVVPLRTSGCLTRLRKALRVYRV